MRDCAFFDFFLIYYNRKTGARYMFVKDWKVPSKETFIFNNKLKVTNIH